jgi:hypothetical protein
MVGKPYSVQYTLDKTGIDRWEELLQTDHLDVALDAVEKLLSKSMIGQITTNHVITHHKAWGETTAKEVKQI